MARPKSFNEDEAIALVNEFHLKYPEREITSTEFALYAQNHGHPEIKHYSIRRNPRVWEYISKINSNTEKEFLLPVVTWERLDVDSFLAVNNTRSKLKTAIIKEILIMVKFVNLPEEF